MSHLPISSIAIAGAWGYIGRKFLDAARKLELAAVVFDTDMPPTDIDLRQVTLCDSADEFYQLDADLFHLALHPEHRSSGFETLLRRRPREPLAVLCEKPMAAPERPEECDAILHATERSPAIVLYDFPELFDPLTQRILDFLGRHDDVRIDSIVAQRSKDREDPAIPRNAKRMVHIQYQESVHCLAFVLFLLARVYGGLEQVLQRGAIVDAVAQPYQPPNPMDYPYVVDGKCEYRLALGDTAVNGRTDFKHGAPWTKRREITGTADGRPFSIVADFLEGKKLLVINGEPQQDVVHTNSYVEVIKSMSQLCHRTAAQDIMSGVYPNPAFARVAYQLSSVLWRSSWQCKPIAIGSLAELVHFQAGFAQVKPQFATYE